MCIQVRSPYCGPTICTPTGSPDFVKPAGATFWGGYSGYFQDPDGHLWEVAWNPQLLPED